MDKRLSIIVLCRDGWADTRRCLRSLRENPPSGPYEVLVVDNASSDGTRAGLEKLAASWPELRVRRSRTNLHFAKALNRATRSTSGGGVLWLNNDTVVPSGALDALLSLLARFPGAGAAGPRTGKMAPPWQLGSPRPGAREAPFLGGFCFLLRREAWENTGPLDERFVWGWEDMDYCLRLRQGGWTLLIAGDVFVPHLGSRSLKRMPAAERRRTDMANRRLILEKWFYREPFASELSELFRSTGASWESCRSEVSILVGGDGKRLPRCLRSIRRCVGELSCEVLAVCSPAAGRSCAALKKSWPGLKLLACAEGTPVSRAMNRAARSARGDYLLFIRDRAVVGPGWVERLVHTAQKNRRAGAVGALTDGTIVSWQMRRAVHRPTPKGMAAAARRLDGTRRSRRVDYLRGGCLLVPRGAWEAVGGFDERFLREAEDVDYCLRLRQAGFEVRVAEDVFVHASWNGAAGRPGSADSKLLFEKWAGSPLFPWPAAGCSRT